MVEKRAAQTPELKAPLGRDGAQGRSGDGGGSPERQVWVKEGQSGWYEPLQRENLLSLLSQAPGRVWGSPAGHELTEAARKKMLGGFLGRQRHPFPPLHLCTPLVTDLKALPGVFLP